jgi:hypothetical protein
VVRFKDERHFSSASWRSLKCEAYLKKYRIGAHTAVLEINRVIFVNSARC